MEEPVAFAKKRKIKGSIIYPAAAGSQNTTEKAGAQLLTPAKSELHQTVTAPCT